MPKFKFSKLVRDKIVDHQIASGAKPNYWRLSIDEHKQEMAPSARGCTSTMSR